MKIYTREIDYKTTHILLRSDLDKDIIPLIKKLRRIVEEEIGRNPEFIGYNPVKIIENPRLLYLMTRAGSISDTGPMSSVAGSISQMCMEYLEEHGTQNSIIENGGDIALKTSKKSVIGVYAGSNSSLGEIGFNVKAKKKGYGICTSSGTVGPSKSFGKTDAAIVFAREASIADSLATQIANYGVGEDDETIVNNSLEKAEDYKEFYDGVVVIKGEYFAKIGKIPEIVSIK